MSLWCLVAGRPRCPIGRRAPPAADAAAAAVVGAFETYGMVRCVPTQDAAEGGRPGAQGGGGPGEPGRIQGQAAEVEVTLPEDVRAIDHSGSAAPVSALR